MGWIIQLTCSTCLVTEMKTILEPTLFIFSYAEIPILDLLPYLWHFWFLIEPPSCFMWHKVMYRSRSRSRSRSCTTKWSAVSIPNAALTRHEAISYIFGAYALLLVQSDNLLIGSGLEWSCRPSLCSWLQFRAGGDWMNAIMAQGLDKSEILVLLTSQWFGELRLLHVSNQKKF